MREILTYGLVKIKYGSKDEFLSIKLKFSMHFSLTLPKKIGTFSIYVSQHGHGWYSDFNRPLNASMSVIGFVRYFYDVINLNWFVLIQKVQYHLHAHFNIEIDYWAVEL